MNLVLEFRKLVFLQVLLGILAFCMAARSLELLLIAGALTLLSWYIVEGPTGRPLPPWCIMLGALGAMAWLVNNMFRQDNSNPIVPLGHFTMWLQILMLYGRKTNREYGEIMVLSMMQMIGASAMSVTLMYGVVLAFYCFVALFAVLVFHLKITNDAIIESNRAAAPRPDRVPLPRPVLGFNHQWHFGATAVAVGSVCAVIAVLVFLSMPRDASGQKNASLITPPRVGWSSRIVYDGSNNAVEDNQPVMYLFVNNFKPEANQALPSFLLRGAALTQYEERSRTWSRVTGSSVVRDMEVEIPAAGRALATLNPGDTAMEVKVQLVPQTERVLFTLLPPVFFKCESIKSILFSPEDQQIVNTSANEEPLEYELRVARPTPPGLFGNYLETAKAFKSRSAIEYGGLPFGGAGVKVNTGLGGISAPAETGEAEGGGKSKTSLLLQRRKPAASQPASESAEPSNAGKGAELFGRHRKKPANTEPAPAPDNGIPEAPQAQPSEVDEVRQSLLIPRDVSIVVGADPAAKHTDAREKKDPSAVLNAAVAARGPASFPPPPDFTRYWNVETERVREFAAGILAKHGIVRDPKVPFDERDVKIAGILADYLRDTRNYKYVTDEPAVEKGKDPIIEFLFVRKQGHCELFAGGLAAMLRSSGIATRLVTGYLAAEYNQLGKYYVVRQSHAHAWVEVYAGAAGWVPVDATPPQPVSDEASGNKRHWWTVMKEAWGYVEKLWIFRVVFKGAGPGVGDGRFTSSPTPEVPGKNWLDKVVGFIKEATEKWEFDAFTIGALVFVAVAIVVAIISMIRVAVVRKRRMVALQLTNLPSRDRKAMVKKLRFYLDMLDLLERYGYFRPSWQSPFGFAKELVGSNPGKFDSVVVLTELFYEIRFGQRQLDEPRVAKIKTELKALENTLLTIKRTRPAQAATAPAAKPA